MKNKSFFRKWQSFMQKDRYKKKLNTLERAIRRDLQNSDLHLQQSILLIELGRIKEAANSILIALRFDPQCVTTFNARELTIEEHNKFEDALDKCRYELEFPFALEIAPLEQLFTPLLEASQMTDEQVAFIEMLDEVIKRPQFAPTRKLDLEGAAERALLNLRIAITIRPLVPEIYSKMGDVMEKLLHAYDEAFALYNLALALDPNNASLYQKEGAMLYVLGRHEEAQQAADAALRLRPDFLEALHTKASAFYELGQFEQALLWFDRIIQLKPQASKAYVGKAFVFVKLNKFDEALQAYNSAIACDPNDATYHLNKGDILSKLKRYKEAILAYDCTLELSLDQEASILYYTRKGNALVCLGDLQGALQVFEEGCQYHEQDSGLFLGKGIILFKRERFQEALSALKRAGSLDPRNPHIDMYINLVLTKLGNHHEALSNVEETNKQEATSVYIHISRGIVLGEAGKHQKAIVEFKKALRLDPHNLGAYDNLSNALRLSHFPEQALEVAEAGLNIHSNDAELYRKKGLAHEDLQQYLAALTAYKRSIQLRPDDANSHHAKGVVLDKMGKHESALEALNEALTLKPHAILSHHSKAIVLHNLHRYEEAIAACDAALQLDPHYLPALLRRKRVTNDMK